MQKFQFSAFACMHNVFPMYRALENTSIKRYSKVVHSSVALSSIFYVSVALAGYITFTDMSQGKITYSVKGFFCLLSPFVAHVS